MSILRVGADLGNSASTLAWGARRPQVLTIPSYLGSGSLGELTRLRAGASAKQGDHADELVLEEKGVEYFVGDLAIRQSLDADSGRGDVSRYWTGHTRRLLLALCASAWPKERKELYVTTGLPQEVWSPRTAGDVARNLIGTHHYRLNGVKHTLTVAAVLVVMEGSGASALCELEDDDDQLAVIDIGGRTTLLYWSQAGEPKLPKCRQLDAGVETIGDRLSAQFAREHNRPLSLSERDGLLRHYLGSSLAPRIFTEKGRADLNGELPVTVAAVADEIASFVRRVWRSGEKGAVAAEAAQVVLIGGGAHYFGERLRALIPRLEIPRQPEVQNALGYLSIGQSVTDDEWAELAGAQQ